MEQSSLLQRYRDDRRKLLQFLLSSGLIRELRTPSGPTASLSGINLDTLSTDYILECVKSGGVIDVLEATKKYYAESAYPVVIHSQDRDSFFLISDPNLTRSPPRHVPPPPIAKQTANHALHSSHCPDSLNSKDTLKSRYGYNYKDNPAVTTQTKPVEDYEIPPLGLPGLNTGLSDDDLQESAYELILASVLLSRVEVHYVEERKKEKGSKLLSSLRSKKEKHRLQPQLSDKHLELINIFRVQMQVSEVMNACIMRNLVALASKGTCGQIDIPQLVLGLLIGIFKSDFPTEKYYMQWKSRQVNLLEELLYFSTSLVMNEHKTVGSCLAKIKDTKEWDLMMSPSQRVEVLSSIRQVASKLSSLPGRFGIMEEMYYWTAAYHLNIRIYEKLLYCVFDILDEGQLIEEADAILYQIKPTWSTLGITQKIHNALYGWVLFKQFVVTDEGLLLEHAVMELQKVISAEEDDAKECLYINSLVCTQHYNGREINVSLVEAILLSIRNWCDSNLQDYHLHFCREPRNFSRVMGLVSTIGIHIVDDSEIKLVRLDALNGDASERIKTYVERSIEAACMRAGDIRNLELKAQRIHPLALLANELRLVAKRELNVFGPVLRDFFPDCMTISAMLVHKFYGERLRPFLRGVSSLSEDVRSVLPAADMLDQDLTQLYNSVEQNKLHSPLYQNLDHYKIGEISNPIILDWTIAQHAHILEWTGRALDLEDWDPLSFQQKQAASIVEVFRIIEETVDQFFGLNLPVNITHLQALLSIVYHSLDAYLLRVRKQLVEKNYLYPAAPPLTRFTETVMPVMKKKLLESTVLDDNIVNKLNELTISKLCVRLNTLQYIQKQIGVVEDGIQNSWALVRLSTDKRLGEKEPTGTLEKGFLTDSEAVHELFATTFNSIKDTTKIVINKICDFIGVRAVFWDLRDMFLLQLYRGDVEGARLESFLPYIDTVLNHICGLIDDTVRDLVVLSIFRSVLHAYVGVLLDGGPSRAFSDSDIMMMEDDLNILKEFFIADGEGLPRSLVEEEAKFPEQILTLFSLEAQTIIQMLMTASELLSMGLDLHKEGKTPLEDAHTLVRVLCHKKDREASKFLKKQYELPLSSEYDDTPSTGSTLKSTLMSDLLKRSTSFRWSKKSQSSFKSFKKKLQEATFEMRNSVW